MYCQKCGTKNEDNAYKCVQCGEALHPGAAAPAPPPSQTNIIQDSSSKPVVVPEVKSYLARAILATIFCCLPFGIISIVFASQVGSKLSSNDYEGARASSKKAKLWFWLAFGIGLAVQIIASIIYLVVIVAAGRS